MSPGELERWKSAQIAALIACGINPLDAHNQATRFLAKLPDGADPNTYVPSDNLMSVDLTSQAVLDDVRAAYYSNSKIPSRFKRLLDARSVD